MLDAVQAVVALPLAATTSFQKRMSALCACGIAKMIFLQSSTGTQTCIHDVNYCVCRVSSSVTQFADNVIGIAGSPRDVMMQCLTGASGTLFTGLSCPYGAQHLTGAAIVHNAHGIASLAVAPRPWHAHACTTRACTWLMRSALMLHVANLPTS